MLSGGIQWRCTDGKVTLPVYTSCVSAGRTSQKSVRKLPSHPLPVINYAATSNTELFNWEMDLVSEQPSTSQLRNEKLTNQVSTPFQVEAFSVHAVAVSAR